MRKLTSLSSFIIPTWAEYLSRPAVVVCTRLYNYCVSYAYCFINRIQLTAEVANALFAVVDGLVAIGMIYYLHHHRTGFKRQAQFGVVSIVTNIG